MRALQDFNLFTWIDHSIMTYHFSKEAVGNDFDLFLLLNLAFMTANSADPDEMLLHFASACL